MIKTIKKENLSHNSWKVYHPNGKLMFLADDKKKDWYLKKNLATQVSSQSIQLTFVPNGIGFDETDIFGLSPRAVQCVCCGEKDSTLMQRHHIVPYMYRKHMPLVYKNKNHHDVVLICYRCHEKYELHANNLKKELLEKYNISDEEKTKKGTFRLNMKGEEGNYRNLGSYITTIQQNKNRIPVDALNRMLAVISDFTGKSDITDIVLKEALAFIQENKDVITETYVPIGKQILSCVDDIDDFVYMWRGHFINTMSPMHMPVGWSVKRRYLPRLD